MTSGDILRISGDKVTLEVSFFSSAMQPINFRINDNAAGVMSFNGLSMDARSVSESIVDLSALPADKKELWSLSMGMASTLMENADFVKLLDEKYSDGSGQLKEGLEKLRDGYYIPSSWGMSRGISSVIRQIYFNDAANQLLGRGYAINGSNHWEILSTSPVGDPHPDLYMSVSNDDKLGFWMMHVDHERGVVEIRQSYQRPGEEVPTLESYGPSIHEMKEMLRYTKRQANDMDGVGLLENKEEFLLFADRLLEGLDKYKWELIPRK